MTRQKVNIAPDLTDYSGIDFLAGGDQSIYPTMRDVVIVSFEIARAFTTGDLQRSVNE